MKSRYLINWSLGLLLLFNQSFILKGQDRMALLLGIGDYPSLSGWPSTNAYNDLNLIKETLIQQGLKQDFIYTFRDSACTKKGIQSALTSFLMPKLKEGMSIYIHFSGLAQQLVDPEENDKLKVAMVTYDAPVKNAKATYDVESFLLVDALKKYFNQIQKQIGPKGQLMVSMDASTAPLNNNSRIAARGSDDKMEASSEADNISKLPVLLSISDPLKDMAPMVGFYSSSFSQMNDEYYSDDNDSYGLFSFALCKSLLLLNKHASYKDWFEKLQAVMSENSSLQMPVMIGEAQLPVFNAQLEGKKTHFEIKKAYSKDLVLINGGKLNQIEKGAEFLFFENTVKDTIGVKPIARAVAEDAKLMEADLRIKEASVNPIPRNAKIFLSSYHYKPLVIRVHVDLGGSELENKLLTHFAFSPFIKKDAIYPELSIVKTKKDVLQLKTRLGTILFQQALKDVNLKEIPFILNEKIAEYLRANFLRNLDIDNVGKVPEIECILVNDGKENRVDGLQKKVHVGSRMKIRITNNSDKGQYFSAIDIQPNHEINVLIPFDKPAAEYYLEAGQSYTTEFEMNVTPPLGKDVIKVIMMSSPLDLRPVIATRGVSNLLDTQKAKNPFEIFMGHTFIEHPVTASEDLKINTSELSSVNGMVLEIEETN